jgi:hypothetical protein
MSAMSEIGLYMYYRTYLLQRLKKPTVQRKMTVTTLQSFGMGVPSN